MNDRQLLENISDADRKKILTRWWDTVILVLGVLGAIFCLLVVMSMTPEDRSSGEVILAVVIFFAVPPLALILIGLRKRIFWSKAKQDAYILKRLAKQSAKGLGIQASVSTPINDVSDEAVYDKVLSSEVHTDTEPIQEITEPELAPTDVPEPEPEITVEEEEDPEIILFPDL